MAGKLHLGMVAALVVAGMVGAAGIFAGGSAEGTVIISDTFSGTNGTTIVARRRDTTDLPGTAWAANGKNKWDNYIQNNQALLGVIGDTIALTGGSVTASTSYAISTTFNISNNPLVTKSDEGAGLGFFTTKASSLNTSGWNYFTGVVVQSSGTGATVELVSSKPTGTLMLLASTTVSSFNASISHTLSYSVDTTTGAMSNLLLDGNTVTLTGTYTPPFTPTATALAGIFEHGNKKSSYYGTFSNFVVYAPEPATLSLMSLIGLGILLGKRRSKKA